MEKMIAVIGNGEIRDYNKIFEKIKGYSTIIAADGGAYHCLKMGITPNLIVGDFDSITKDVLDVFKNVAKLPFPREKDETDLEIAIREAVSLGSKKVALFAASGNRLDHSLVNLYLLIRYSSKIFLETENETVIAVSKNFPLKIEGVLGKTVSLLPFGKKVIGLSTKGLKWEIDDRELDENFFSISNVCVEDTIFVSLKEGDLFCFLNQTL